MRDLVEPATGRRLAALKTHDPDHVKEKVQKAREAQTAWAETPLRKRQAHAREIGRGIVERADLFAQIISRSTGKTRMDALSSDVFFALVHLPGAAAGDAMLAAGQSGIGRSHGALGFEEMTQPRVIVDDLLHRAPRNMWWYPHDRSMFNGLKSAMIALHGRGLFRRLGGLGRLVRTFMRSFRKA